MQKEYGNMKAQRLTQTAGLLKTALLFGLCAGTLAGATRQMEYLDRGVVAVRSGNAAFISWRSLATDDAATAFNVYRVTDGDTTKLTTAALTAGTNYTDATADLTLDNTYFVTTVLNGTEKKTAGSHTMPANKTDGPFVTVPIQAGGTIHFVWVGDLNGDGSYDYVLDRPVDDEQKLEAYTNTGTLLWTLNLGANSANKNNISPGASTLNVGMWDGATVYDIDLDGKAEVLVRIADGVTFGDGTKFSLSGTNAQAIAVLDGETGKLESYALTPTDYISVDPLACMMEIGYLDGSTPSLICWLKNRNSDKTFNSLMVAYHISNGKLVQQWKYNVTSQGGGAEAHQIRIADVDYDGKDEVLHMGYCLNGDGTLRYVVPTVVHGDRWYVGAFNKGDKVMMGYGIQQDHPSNLLEYHYNASTGDLVWTHYGDASCNGQCDVARGNIGDIDPNYPGYEVWSFQGAYNAATNTKIDTNYMYPVLRLWWDGDLFAESYNDGKIEKWDYTNKWVSRAATTWNIYGSSGSDRGVAMFHGDILGDWREESILVNYTTNELVIFTTNIPSDYRIYALAQNPAYRNHMTAKGYVQAAMLDYYLGDGMDTPPTPDISIVGHSGETFEDMNVTTDPYLVLSGSSEQTLFLGDSIASFSYLIKNSTSTVATGLPDGVTATVSGNYIYITGTPTETGTFNFTVTTKNDEGYSSSETGTITVVGQVETVTAGTMLSLVNAAYPVEGDGLYEDKNAGWIDSGYYNFTNSISSYGYWKLASESEGTATLVIRYALGGTDTDRNMSLTFNDEILGRVKMPSTVEWTTYDSVAVTVTLKKGLNTLRLGSMTENGGPNVDEFEFDVAGVHIWTDAEDPENPDAIYAGIKKTFSMNVVPGKVTLTLANSASQGTMNLFSTTGKNIRQAQITCTRTEMSTEGLPGGVYLISCKANGISFIKKVRIE